MKNDSGFLYVLINPAAPNLVKVGKTTRLPEERARELSSDTGVPEDFVVAYQAFFSDCSKAENFVHNYLDEHRIKGKEFFRVTPTEAIRAVVKAESKFGTEEAKDITDELKKEQDITSSGSGEDVCREILETADAYLYGYGQFLKDENEAIGIYKKAVALGCKKAYRRLADIYWDKYYSGEKDSTKYLKRALNYYKKGAKEGDAICWGHMALCYSELEEYSNADKCFFKLFTHPSLKGKEAEKPSGSILYSFIQYMGSAGRQQYRDLQKLILGSTKEGNDKDINGAKSEQNLHEKQVFATLEHFYQELLDAGADELY